MSDRCREFFSGVPLVTVFLLALNLSIHAAVFLLTIDIRDFTLHPNRVIYFSEYYRCVSAALLHGGAMHILMNMMTLFSLGSSMERKIGSLHFFLFTMWAIVLCGAFYSVLSWLLTWVTGNMSFLMQPAVGYSGVLFAYILIECYHTSMQSRSFFGLFSVPSKLYPWLILIAMQFVMPNISFLGHLSGILVGLMAVYGVFDYMIPTYEFCLFLEGSQYCCNIYRFSNYVLAVDYSLKIPLPDGAREVGLVTRIYNGCKWVVVALWHFISTILFIIGCPVDAFSTSITLMHASSVNYINSLFRGNRNVFETDSPSEEETSNMESGRSREDSYRFGSNNNVRSGASETVAAVDNNLNEPDIEANRKNARDARLQKFANFNAK